MSIKLREFTHWNCRPAKNDTFSSSDEMWNSKQFFLCSHYDVIRLLVEIQQITLTLTDDGGRCFAVPFFGVVFHSQKRCCACLKLNLSKVFVWVRMTSNINTSASWTCSTLCYAIAQTVISILTSHNENAHPADIYKKKAVYIWIENEVTEAKWSLSIRIVLIIV